MYYGMFFSSLCVYLFLFFLSLASNFHVCIFNIALGIAISEASKFISLSETNGRTGIKKRPTQATKKVIMLKAKRKSQQSHTTISQSICKKCVWNFFRSVFDFAYAASRMNANGEQSECKRQTES